MRTNILGQGEFEAKMITFKQPIKKKKVILLTNAVRIAKEADGKINDLEFHNAFQDQKLADYARHQKSFIEQLKRYTQIAFDNENAFKEQFHIECPGFLRHFSMHNIEVYVEFKGGLTSTKVTILTYKFIEWANSIELKKGEE